MPTDGHALRSTRALSHPRDGAYSTRMSRLREEEVETKALGTTDSTGPQAPRLDEGESHDARYVVLGEAGRGAMGLVLRAYDQKLQREVALKEVRAGAIGTNGAARLVAEARAMAQLSHPNVVAVYDVDETAAASGVTLVMEYVAGTTLRAWLRADQRDANDILARFVLAGRGLVAAHEAGVLHRDFKPANVLVSDTGAVKVTDFGLARPTVRPGDVSESAHISASGMSVASFSPDGVLTGVGLAMGTPRYMAPEQYSGVELTDAADQYAFCIALWEALCAEPPFTEPGTAKAKAAGPPPWPNPSVPRRIADAISRGLAADPRGRWSSMSELLGELTRRPPNRRRTLGVAALGLGGVGLAGAAWASRPEPVEPCGGAREQLAGVWDTAKRSTAKAAIADAGVSYAEPVWARTSAEIDSYAEAWVEMHRDTCEATTVRGEQSTSMMDLRMACLRRARHVLAATTDVLASADAGVVRRAHSLVSGLRPLESCSDAAALIADVDPPSGADAEGVNEVQKSLATAAAQAKAGHYEAAETILNDAAEVLAALDYGPLWAELKLQQAGVSNALGHYEASELILREALEYASRWRQWAQMHRAAVRLMFTVGDRLQRPEDGMRYREVALGLANGEPRFEGAFHHSLAAILLGQGKYDEAVPASRRAVASWIEGFGEAHTKVAEARGNLAVVLHAAGKYEESLTEHRRALAGMEGKLGPSHPTIAALRHNLAIVLNQTGKLEAAEVEYRRVIELRELELGLDHPDVAASRHGLATLLFDREKYVEAESEDRRALAIQEAVLDRDHPSVARTRASLASTLLAEEKFEEAEVEARRALAARKAAQGPEHPDVARSHETLARVLDGQDRYPAARVEFTHAVELATRVVKADHPFLASTRAVFALSLIEHGEHEEALPLAEMVWEQRKGDDVPPSQRAEAAYLMSRALAGAGQLERARTFATRALGAYERADASESEGAERLRDWLGQSPGAAAKSPTPRPTAAD